MLKLGTAVAAKRAKLTIAMFSPDEACHVNEFTPKGGRLMP